MSLRGWWVGWRVVQWQRGTVRVSQRDRFTIQNDPGALAIEAWWRVESAARKLLLENGVDDEIGSPSEVVRR